MARVHIVALTPDLQRALVVPTAAGWLLPCAEVDSRASLIAVIDIVLKRLSGAARLVHWAPIPPCATNGRAAVDPSTDRYCLALIDGPCLSPSVIAAPIDSLRSTRPLLATQRDAFEIAVSRVRHPQQCFDSAEQVTAALDWVTRTIAHIDARPIATRPYRCSRNDYVIGFETTAGLMYFKAGRGRTSDEAPLCDLLHAIAPDQFPTTICVDRVNDRWLYRALVGEQLSEPALTSERVMAAVHALVDLQKRTMHAEAARAHLSPRRVCARDVLARADRIVSSIWRESELEDADVVQAWQRFMKAGDRLCAALDALALPMTLVFSDFWSANVVMTADGIGFIDVEHAYWTYPFVPLWRFGRDVERQLQTGGVMGHRIEQAFIDAWADLVSPRLMTYAVGHLPLLGQLFSLLMSSRDLDRHEEDLGIPLGASYRAARLRDRITALARLCPHDTRMPTQKLMPSSFTSERPARRIERDVETLRCRDVETLTSDPEYLWRRGSIALARGELDVAIACLRRAVTLDGANATYCATLGHALLQRRRHAEALGLYLRGLTLAPQDAALYRATARALQAHGLLRESAALYREALSLDPRDAPTFNALGDALRRQHRLAEALEACETAVRLEPEAPYHHWQLGSVLASRREWDAALVAFARGLEALDRARIEGQGHEAIAVNPMDADRVDADRMDTPSAEELRVALLTSAGDMLQHLGRTREAVTSYREAVTLLPRHVRACRQLALALEFGGGDAARDAPAAWVALGVALQARDRFEEARAAYQQALARAPQCLRAAINLARTHASFGDTRAAIHWFGKALAIDPEHPAAHTDFGRACYLAGDADRAWNEFAWFHHPQALKRRALEQPLWDGCPVGSRTMLVWAEQALGDTIQWLRYVPLLKALYPSARLILECQQNLVPLARNLEGVEMVIGEGAPPPHIDLHVPLSLVPVVCRPLRHHAPWQVPYLSVDEGLVETWRRRLDRADTTRTARAKTRLTVGLSWAGHPDGIAARQRFTSLAAFAPLAAVEGVRFVSLQIGRQAAQVLGPPAGLQIEQLQDDSHSTHDTAALMQSLDLVVTVDTMIAHLAGALARPVWVVLPHVADWRWLHDGDRSPFYPTMTLFRQTCAGDWQELFERVRDALRRM